MGLDNQSSDKMTVEVRDITDHISNLGDRGIGDEFLKLIEKDVIFEIDFSKTTPWMMYSKHETY